MSVNYPVRILVDNFSFLNESIPKGSIFNCMTSWQESFLCDQEGQAVRLKPGEREGLIPSSVGSYHLVYEKSDVTPDTSDNGSVDPPDPKPVRRRPGRPGRTTKARVKIGSGKYKTQNMAPDENPGSD